MIQDMLILKYSHLSREKQLVKFLANGKYGIYNHLTDDIFVEPVFDLLQYHSHTDSIWAKENGHYFLIDHSGKRLDDVVIAEEDWMFVDKNDRCPSCTCNGCRNCYGFGVVPIGGDYSGYFDD
ncbi:hypothetical protein [Pontibacter sp. FD36]|uniref:hypothetical protein n=1 Tax=Pontibacter sp. FD36 TaxID=2789860 RepID=UPI001E34B06A|nr:hypothetical protein [Pontibacter sp. FD36]